MKQHVIPGALLAALFVPLFACHGARDELLEPEAPVVEEVPAAVPTNRSVMGDEIPVVTIGAGDAVLLIASIHGNEPSGTPLLEDLLRRVREGEVRVPPDRSIVVVPVVNPDGLARRRRTNANGVDLNRNFPSENFQPHARQGSHPLSEPESRLVAQLIRKHEPIRILSFHEPVNCIDWDGPAEDLARELSEVSPLPIQRLGTRPGSLGSWTGVGLGIPTLTIELPAGSARLGRDDLWERYGELVETAIRY